MFYRISFSVITAKMFFLSSLLISLYYKSIKGVFYTRTDIFAGGGYLTNMSVEVKWFSIIGFLVIEYF